MTLIDDPSTSIRSRGLRILSVFLPRFPPKLLQQTGLGPVFEDAVHPTLLFLPSITPADESVRLLPSVYRALDVLAEVRFGEGEKDIAERTKFFDRIMREGILGGFFHVAEYPAIIEVIIEQLSIVVSRMGINSVKHLKVFPYLASNLVNMRLTNDPLGYNSRSFNYFDRSVHHSFTTVYSHRCVIGLNPKRLAKDQSRRSSEENTYGSGKLLG